MKILIALDESPVSARAAREAVRLFSPAGAHFLVVNVATVPTTWVGLDFGVVAPLDIDPKWLETDEEDEADLMALARGAGVADPEIVAIAGDPVTRICSAAEEHGVDVIVVGSHDKSALRRLVDPSVAAGVVRATYRPVLVVSGKPPSAAL